MPQTTKDFIMYVLVEYHIDYHIEEVYTVACSEDKQLLEALKESKEDERKDDTILSVTYDIEECPKI